MTGFIYSFTVRARVGPEAVATREGDRKLDCLKSVRTALHCRNLYQRSAGRAADLQRTPGGNVTGWNEPSPQLAPRCTPPPCSSTVMMSTEHSRDSEVL